MEKTEGDTMTTETATVIPIPVQRKPGPPKGSKMPKWTAERRAKFQRTMRRKAKEAARAAREGGRRGSKGASPIARSRAPYAARQAARGGSAARIGPHTEAIGPRTGRSAGEERADAIAFLRAATEGYEGIPTSVCYGLLALRRLLGQIK